MSAFRKFLTVLTIAAVGGGVGAAALAARDTPEGASIAAAIADENAGVVELAQVEVSTIERRDIADDVRLSGSLQPARTTVLNARTGGTVEEVLVDVGASVAAGEVVAKVDTDALTAELRAQEANREALRAQLSLARTVLERSQRLGQSGITSEAALLEAEANVLNLEAQLKAIEAQLAEIGRQIGDATILAPFDGIVSARAVNPGQTVAPNAELLTLVDLSRLELNAAIPTSRIAAVEIGQSATFAVEGFGGQTFTSEVVRISPIAEAGSRAVRVFLSIENDAERLRGGMFASGALRIGRQSDVIALPSAAIRRDDAGDFVLRAADGRLHRQPVETGTRWDDQGLVEIASGLNEGDVVVTAPLPDLQPDVDIRIAEL